MKKETLKIENILSTDYSMEANIIILEAIPTIEEQNKLFGSDDSVVLEF